jgi:hypothetical protein
MSYISSQILTQTVTGDYCPRQNIARDCIITKGLLSGSYNIIVNYNTDNVNDGAYFDCVKSEPCTPMILLHTADVLIT